MNFCKKVIKHNANDEESFIHCSRLDESSVFIPRVFFHVGNIFAVAVASNCNNEF